MKLLDTILRQLIISNGDAVLLRASEAPLMLTGNSQSPLPLAGLAPDHMAEIVAEIVPLSVRARLRDSGSVQYTVPATEDRQELAITAIGHGDDVWLEVRPQVPTAVALQPHRPSDPANPGVNAPVRATADRKRIANVDDVNELITRLAGRGDSSLFLHSGLAPAAKIDGTVRWLDEFEPLDADDLGRILVELSGDIARHGGVERDDMLCWTLPDIAIVECRASLASPSIQLTFGIKSTKPIDAGRLGIPPALADICREDYGLLVIAGLAPEYVGRTCHSLVDLVNRECRHHVIVLERQAVTRHHRGAAFLSHRVVTGDDEAWTRALIGALDEAPDVLMTQHVPSWPMLDQLMTHASDALIIIQVPGGSVVAALQELLKSVPAAHRSEALTRLAESFVAVVAQREVRPRGGAGISAYEMVWGTSGVRDLLRQSAFDQLALTLERGVDGMIPMSAAIADLGRKGRIGPKHARVLSPEPTGGRSPREESREQASGGEAPVDLSGVVGAMS